MVQFKLEVPGTYILVDHSLARLRDVWTAVPSSKMERAVLDLGVKFATVRQWRYRGFPTRWQIRLMMHFGGMILIDDVASADLPPVKQRTLAEILSREVPHTFRALQKGAAGFLDVEGAPNPKVFESIQKGSTDGGGH